MTIEATMRATGLKSVRGQLERLQRQGVKGWQDAAAKELVRELQQTSPKDTGKFAKSWSVKQKRNRTKYKTVIHVAPAKKYQKLFNYLEYGTKPHEILPVRANMLHWVDEGGMHHFRYRVWHPGTKPYKFATKAMRKILPRVMQNVIKTARQQYIWLKR